MISSLSLVSWLRGLTISKKINLTIISGKRVKKSVEMRQHKIKQINYWPVFKETIKVEDKKKIELSWNLHSRSYSVIEIAQDSQINMSLSILKILKSIIFNLSIKIIKFFTESFLFLGSFFLHRCLFFAQGFTFFAQVHFLFDCAPLYKLKNGAKIVDVKLFVNINLTNTDLFFLKFVTAKFQCTPKTSILGCWALVFLIFGVLGFNKVPS